MFVVTVASPLSLVDSVAFAVLSDVLSAPRVSSCRLFLRCWRWISSQRCCSRGVSGENLHRRGFPVIWWIQRCLSGLFLCVITSAEREVKHSRRSWKSQSCFFWDKIRHAKSVGFWFYLAISDVVCEISRDHFDFFDLFFNLFEEERITILAFPGFEPTHLCYPSDQRRD